VELKEEAKVRRFTRVKTCRGCQYANGQAEDIVMTAENAISTSNLETALKAKSLSSRFSHHPFEVNIANCPNGCSRPQISDISIISLQKPKATEADCYMCGLCEEACKEDAVDFSSGKPVFDFDKCISCGDCIRVCPSNAIASEGIEYQFSIAGRMGRHPKMAMEIGITASQKELEQWMINTCNLYSDEMRKDERFYMVADRFSLNDLKQRILNK